MPTLTDERSTFTASGRLQTRVATPTPTNAIPSPGGDSQGEGGTNSTTFAYAYDPSGNMTNAVGGGQSWALKYDEDNRVASLSWDCGMTHKDITNRYDALGRRIARKVDGIETRYVLDLSGGMERVLCDTTASGQVTAYYIHGLDLCYRVDASNNIICYHADAQANIIAVTDGGGTNVAQYAYTPYGRGLGSTNRSTNLQSQITNPYLFVGSQGVMEDLPGLYFMRARYYSADAGVFLSTDPVKHIGPGWKPEAYGYSGENPLRYNDPDGRLLHIAAGAFIGGVVGFTLENARQWGDYLGGGEGFNVEKLIQKTLGGGVAGGIGAATFGGSFIVGGAAGELTETAIEDLFGEDRSVEDYVRAARNGAIAGSISHFLGGLVSIGKSGQLYPGNVKGPDASTFIGGVSGSHGVNEAVKGLLIDGVKSAWKESETVRDQVAKPAQPDSGKKGTTGGSDGSGGSKTPSGGSPTTYTVKAGDTLGNIGSKFGSSATAIGAANGIKNLNLIHPGQVLTIPRR